MTLICAQILLLCQASARPDSGPITVQEVKRNLIHYHHDLPGEPPNPEEEIRGPKVLLRYKERAFPAYHELLDSKRVGVLSKSMILRVIRTVDADISEFLPQARKLATDNSLRYEAVRLLGIIGESEDAKLLISMLPDSRIRHGALESLQKIGRMEHALELEKMADTPPCPLDENERESLRKAAAVIRSKHRR